jgi:hypothetical protein
VSYHTTEGKDRPSVPSPKYAHLVGMDPARARTFELRFGPYSGWTLGEVADVEPAYLVCVAEGFGPEPVKIAAQVLLRDLEARGTTWPTILQDLDKRGVQ